MNELPFCAKSWEIWGEDAVDELCFVWVNVFHAILAVHSEEWATRRDGTLETAMSATFRVVKLSCNNFAPAFPEVCHCQEVTTTGATFGVTTRVNKKLRDASELWHAAIIVCM